MALVNVVNMVVLDNPANILSPFQFEITFECLQELEDDLEWKVVYVGSAQDSVYDQVLDEILVGPVPVGINKFVLQVDAPNVHQLPAEEVLGVTVVLVTCSYKEREFVRVGYYVNNEYQYSPEEMATFQQAQAQYQQAVQLIQQQQQPPSLTTATKEEPTTTTVVPTADGDEDEGTAPNDNKQQLPPAPQLPPPPTPLDFGKVQRHILADKPRVTKFPIPWTLNDITNTTATTNNNNPSSNGVRQDHAINGNDENADDNMETSFVKVEDEADEEEHGDDDGAADTNRIFNQEAMEEDVQEGAAVHGNDDEHHEVEHNDLAPAHAMERPLTL